MNKVPYASVVESLMYEMVCTKPDTAYAVRVVNQFMSDSGKEHWTAIKWIFWYLKGTSSVRFSSDNPMLEGFTDSYISTDGDTSRSVSRYLMTFVGESFRGSTGMQKVVALSTTKAEGVYWPI